MPYDRRSFDPPSRAAALPRALAGFALVAGLAVAAAPAMAQEQDSRMQSRVTVSNFTGTSAFVEFRCRSEGDRPFGRLTTSSRGTEHRDVEGRCEEYFVYGEVDSAHGVRSTCRSAATKARRANVHFSVKPMRKCEIHSVDIRP